MSGRRQPRAKAGNRARAADGDLIDEYLGELRRLLAGSGIVRNSRERAMRVVDEAADHLRESAAAGVAAGMSEQDAQRAAVMAFGAARTVASAHRPRPAAALAAAATALCGLLGTFVLAAACTGEIAAVLCAPDAASNPGGVLANLDAVSAVPSNAGSEPLLARLTAASHDPAGYAVSFGAITLIGVALLAARFIADRRADGGARVAPLLWYPAVAAGCALFYAGNLTSWLQPGAIAAGPLGHLQGGDELSYGAILAAEMLVPVYVLWSAVQLIRWVAARVTASRQPAVIA